MKATKKKLKHYVISVKMQQVFETLKDVDAHNEDEAIEMVKEYATKEFKNQREIAENWSEYTDCEVVGTDIEDEYEV